ncbi:MAG: alanine racemase [Candidatus Peribacteria bacterium]|nr:MAG: alanine racemase [Candidatus Peribacteria bacterium]
MVQIFKKLFAPKVQPLNLVTVSRKKILHNLYHLQMLQPGLELFPVIKSNAYGHGIELMCKLLAETTISTVCVDSFIEYQYVEKHTTKDILLLGETNHHNYSLFDFKRTIFAVSNLDTLNYLIGLKRTIRIHLFVNTGMNREGFSEKDLKKSLLILPGSKLKVDGVMSHFHSADLPNMKSMKEQVSLFKKYYHRIEEAGFSPKYRHISASAGILKLQDSFFNAGRPGIAMYGYNPLLKKDKYYKNGEDLQPALEVFTTVVGIQKVKSGEGVSYGYTHVCKENAILATIPFGYYE